MRKLYSFTIEEDVYKALSDIRWEERVSMSRIVEDLLKEYLKKRGKLK